MKYYWNSYRPLSIITWSLHEGMFVRPLVAWVFFKLRSDGQWLPYFYFTFIFKWNFFYYYGREQGSDLNRG